MAAWKHTHISELAAYFVVAFYSKGWSLQTSSAKYSLCPLRWVLELARAEEHSLFYLWGSPSRALRCWQNLRWEQCLFISACHHSQLNRGLSPNLLTVCKHLQFSPLVIPVWVWLGLSKRRGAETLSGAEGCAYMIRVGDTKVSRLLLCTLRTYSHPSCFCFCGCCLVVQSCLTLATPWTEAHQGPLCMKFSRQEYWSGLPFPPPGDLPDPGVEPTSPVLMAVFFTAEQWGDALLLLEVSNCVTLCV